MYNMVMGDNRCHRKLASSSVNSWDGLLVCKQMVVLLMLQPFPFLFSSSLFPVALSPSVVGLASFLFALDGRRTVAGKREFSFFYQNRR